MAGYQVSTALFQDKRCESPSEADALRLFHEGTGLLWINIVGEDVEAVTTLLKSLNFHPLEIEDAVSPHERPALRADDEGMFLVVPAVEPNGDEEEHYVEVAFFVGQSFVVTVSTHHAKAVDQWFNRCLARPTAAGRTPDSLLHSLVDALVDGYFPAVDELGEQIDNLESRIFGGEPVNVAEALVFKRRLLEMRRRIAPVRDILNSLLRRDITFVSQEARLYFQDVFDHTLRVAELIDMQREVLSAVLDAHLSIVSNNLNRVMRTMTIISTLLMSMAFVAGVYGMNFRYMPELNWFWGYPFSLLLMVAIAAFELVIFRKLKWM